MRPKINTQSELNFQPSNLKITKEYYAKYESISRTLDENPEILDAVHNDLEQALEDAIVEDKGGGRYEYTSDTVLRIVLCQIIEGMSLRQTIIRVDESDFLRRFVRIFNGPMMDYTTYDRLKNCIKPEIWKKVNELLRASSALSRSG